MDTQQAYTWGGITFVPDKVLETPFGQFALQRQTAAGKSFVSIFKVGRNYSLSIVDTNHAPQMVQDAAFELRQRRT